MKDFKGTKGKWNIEKMKYSFLISCDNPNWDICQTISDTKIDEANAKLIASAPEMFEMLKQTFEWLYNDQRYSVKNPYLKQIEQLLTKITE